MTSRFWITALLAAGWAASCQSARADDKELSPEAAQALKFVSGLRERGYHDVAADYIEILRKSPGTPADLKETLDYQDGRGLLEEATITSDPDKKGMLLDAARTKLDSFTKTHATHELAPDALMQLARLFIERGHSSLILSKELKGSEAAAKLSAARASFAEARMAYDRALPTLKTKLDSFPKYIPDEQKTKIEGRKRAQETFQNAMLQKTVVDYEDAQTWPPGSTERNGLLDKGVVAFEGLYKDYRGQLSGLTARMLQGKCYEEKGTTEDLGKAMGIYNELIGQSIRDAQYDNIRRTVGYYQIIVDGKRKDYALAVDRASQWLRDNPRSRGTEYDLGVKLELAKNILAQLPDLKESDREEAMRKAADRLNEVVRFYSPYKPEALELLRKYKPKSALTANQIAAMSYDDSMVQADSSLSTHEWDRAITLLRHAIKRADPAKEPVKANEARYLLSYAYYSSQRYYESAVLAEHLARRYPTREFSDKAADLGLNAYSMAYNTYNAIDRASDLDRLVDLARHIIATWPDSEQGDTARNLLGEVEMGRGNYAEAAKALESIRASSPRKLDAQVKAGDCRWRLGLQLRDSGKTSEAESQEKAAFDLTKTALDARKAAGTPPTDPAVIINTNALAEIFLKTGKPKEALAVLEPLAKALAGQTLAADVAPRFEALLTVMLQAHIADGQSAKAIDDMKALEKTGISRAELTNLYFQLSKTLEREMEAQKTRKDMRAFAQTQEAYKKFLTALAESKSGQSFDSLMFAGNAMLALEMPKQAIVVFDRVLKDYGKDPAMKVDPQKGGPLLRLNLKRAEALRKDKQFADGLKLLDTLITDYRGIQEPILEKGYLLEDWGRAERKSNQWSASYDYWKKLSTQFEKLRPRRPEYYDCIYHMAIALQGLGRNDDAARSLRGVMTLSPSVGKPEIKAKYVELLKQLGK